MGYRIPREQEVAAAIENVLCRQPHIRSQRELVMLVSTELMCDDQDYRIGASRIRRIGVKRRLFNISISYAHDGRGSRRAECPVCGGKLDPVMNRTLDGDAVELRRVCGECGYRADPGSARPARYVIDRRLKIRATDPISSGRQRSC